MRPFGTGAPAMRSGATARGWMMRVNSRADCLSRTSARIIFIPPPVEPEEEAKQHRNSIHSGANAGHRA